MSTTAQIQEIYVGLLGRAADAEGLAYWEAEINGGVLTIEQLRANIVNEQPEYAANLGSLSREALVEALYENLFERAPEAEGLTYWTTGEGSSVNADQLVLALSNGASTADRAALDNKTAAATYYTENAPTYSSATANAAVADVDGTSTTLAASQAATDVLVQAAQGITGTTQALTASADDDLTGTAANDLFTARAGHIDATDQIDGSAGFDRLEIELTAPVTNAFEVKNVEDIVVNVATTTAGDIATTAGAYIDATNIDDATITINRAYSGMTTSASVDAAGSNIIVAGSGIATLEVDGNDEALIDTGSASSLVLGVSAAANDLDLKAGANVAVTDSAGGTASLATAITVTSDNGARIDISGMAGMLAAPSLEDVVINGDATLRIDLSNVAAAGYEVSGTGTFNVNADANAVAVLDMVDVLAETTISGGLTLDVDNLEGKSVTLTGSTANTVTIDTSGDDDIESASVVLASNDQELLVGTTVATGATNVDSVTVTVDAARVGAMTVDSDVTLNIGDNDVAFATSAGVATAIVSRDSGASLIVTGSGAFTANSLDVATFDATAATGAVTLNIAADENGDVSDIRTGTGDDVIVQGAAGGAVNIYTDGGDDYIDLTDQANTDAVLVVAGSGNDEVQLGDAAAQWAGTDAILVGGTGTDTLVVDIRAGDADLSDVTTSEFEVLTLKADTGTTLTIDHGFFNKQTMTVNGETTSISDITLTSGATGRAIDISGITFDSAVNTVTVDLSAVTISTTSPAGVSAKLSSEGETVSGYAFDSTQQFSLDLGAGDDTLTLSANGGTAGVGGVLTLGAGDDIVVVVTDSSTSTGTSSDMVRIADWSDDDTLDVSGLVAAAVGPDTSGVAVDVDAADAAGLATDIKAAVEDGMVTLSGADASAINTLAEWIDVIDLLTDDMFYAFEFNGNTYVVEHTAAANVETVIELTGVTGKTLGSGGTGVIALDLV